MVKKIVGKVILCHDTKFKGIDCLEKEGEYGFEGCYNNNLNHPDPRPAHRIWIKKIEAEKLFKLFTFNNPFQRKNLELLNCQKCEICLEHSRKLE